MSKLLKVGVVGTVLGALCCFTPLLVVVLGALGLSWAVGYLDYVLLPLLGVFVVITVVAIVKKTKATKATKAT